MVSSLGTTVPCMQRPKLNPKETKMVPKGKKPGSRNPGTEHRSGAGLRDQLPQGQDHAAHQQRTPSVLLLSRALTPSQLNQERTAWGQSHREYQRELAMARARSQPLPDKPDQPILFRGDTMAEALVVLSSRDSIIDVPAAIIPEELTGCLGTLKEFRTDPHTYKNVSNKPYGSTCRAATAHGFIAKWRKRGEDPSFAILRVVQDPYRRGFCVFTLYSWLSCEERLDQNNTRTPGIILPCDRRVLYSGSFPPAFELDTTQPGGYNRMVVNRLSRFCGFDIRGASSSGVDEYSLQKLRLYRAACAADKLGAFNRLLEVEYTEARGAREQYLASRKATAVVQTPEPPEPPVAQPPLSRKKAKTRRCANLARKISRKGKVKADKPFRTFAQPMYVLDIIAARIRANEKAVVEKAATTVTVAQTEPIRENAPPVSAEGSLPKSESGNRKLSLSELLARKKKELAL